MTIVFVGRAREFPEIAKRRVETVYGLFPELRDREVRVGFTGVAAGLAYTRGGLKICLERNPSYETIAHEFSHLVGTQGERATDLYAADRLPVELIDDRFTYLKLRDYDKDDFEDRKKIKELAHEALTKRGYAYVKRVEAEFKSYKAGRKRA